MAARSFPEIQPSGRSYSPGRIPETVFEAQNGSTSFVQFGSIFTNASLSLQFDNISDNQASVILQHYLSVVGDDHVEFGGTNGLGGIDSTLRSQLEKGTGAIKWRYDGPPEIRSVYPGISSVTCSFIGYLFGV